MNTVKQRRKLKLLEQRQKRENGIDPNKNVCARHIHYALASERSKPARITLPEIGNDKMMATQTGNMEHVGGGEEVAIHLPPLPVTPVPQLQLKKSNKLSSASSLHPQQGRGDLQKLTTTPAVAKQGSSNMEGSQLKRERPMPARLLPIKMTRSSSSALGFPIELNTTSKLPDIKLTPAKCPRTESGNVHKRPRILPPISRRTEELDKNC